MMTITLGNFHQIWSHLSNELSVLFNQNLASNLNRKTNCPYDDQYPGRFSIVFAEPIKNKILRTNIALFGQKLNTKKCSMRLVSKMRIVNQLRVQFVIQRGTPSVRKLAHLSIFLQINRKQGGLCQHTDRYHLRVRHPSPTQNPLWVKRLPHIHACHCDSIAKLMPVRATRRDRTSTRRDFNDKTATEKPSPVVVSH